MRSERGFTLVELIIVVVISAILSGMVSAFIARPVEAYVESTKRAALTDTADTALRRMQRELRKALPNSVRVAGGGAVIEFIPTTGAARYRDGAPGTDAQILAFNAADTSFNLLGTLPGITRPFSSTTQRLVVYNVGASGADAYAGTGVITPSGMTVGIDTDSSSTSADRVSLSGTGMQFVQPSPTQRIYLVETPVSYLCDTSAGTLTRHEGHPLAATQLTTAASLTAAGAASAALARQVTSCAFTYQNGTTERGGLVLLDLTLADGPEQVRLLLQAHVDNLP